MCTSAVHLVYERRPLQMVCQPPWKSIRITATTWSSTEDLSIRGRIHGFTGCAHHKTGHRL